MDDWLKQRVKSLALQLLALVRNSNGVILILNFFFKKKNIHNVSGYFSASFCLGSTPVPKEILRYIPPEYYYDVFAIDLTQKMNQLVNDSDGSLVN